MIKAYRRTSFRYDFIRENHEKEINFSFKFVSQEGKDKKKPHFKGLNLHFEFFNIKKIVIEPNEIEAVKILPNQDMITLFTCHPYGMETQRYVVYASRKSIYNDIELPKGVTYTSSRKEIAIEKTLNNCLLFASGLLAVILIIESIRMNKM